MLATNSLGNITTQLGSQTMSQSFIDSGSNGLFFDMSTLTPCSAAYSGFYCPASTTSLTATMAGISGSALVSFSVGNAQSLLNTSVTALPTLAGPMNASRTFDWGLPFFYGRSVFYGIAQTSSTWGTGPLIAF